MTEGRFAPPFFEFGPKNFLPRQDLLPLLEAASVAAVEAEVTVIVTPPVLDLEASKRHTPDLWVFAQAMDPDAPGSSTGALTPEALSAVGVDGVMINHPERKLPDAVVDATTRRALEVGLRSLVIAPDESSAVMFARLRPDLMLLEPPHLIGSGVGRVPRPWVASTNARIREVHRGAYVMHAGGVTDPHDAAEVIRSGADGTGCTTAVLRAPDRALALGLMIRAVGKAWREAASSQPPSEVTP